MSNTKVFEAIDATRSDLKQVVRPVQIERLQAQLRRQLAALTDDQLAAYAKYRMAQGR